MLQLLQISEFPLLVGTALFKEWEPLFLELFDLLAKFFFFFFEDFQKFLVIKRKMSRQRLILLAQEDELARLHNSPIVDRVLPQVLPCLKPLDKWLLFTRYRSRLRSLSKHLYLMFKLSYHLVGFIKLITIIQLFLRSLNFRKCLKAPHSELVVFLSPT